ncbi:MAG: F0F1 ATP synthase subunit A, partial [Desulfobacterales bacterium]
MGELGKLHQLIIPVFGHNITINLEVVLMTWIVIVLLIVLGLLASYKKNIMPRPIQVVGELFISVLYGLTEDALGKELAKTYAPLICALFLFLLLSNWLGIIPHLAEPTKDLNTTLGLGIMGFFIAHYAGIKSKG